MHWAPVKSSDRVHLKSLFGRRRVRIRCVHRRTMKRVKTVPDDARCSLLLMHPHHILVCDISINRFRIVNVVLDAPVVSHDFISFGGHVVGDGWLLTVSSRGDYKLEALVYLHFYLTCFVACEKLVVLARNPNFPIIRTGKLSKNFDI